MNFYLATYDLRKPGRNYDALWKRLGEWGAIRVLESTWLINWPSTAEKVCDDLRSHIDENDGLFVVSLTGEAAWANVLSNPRTHLSAAANAA